MNVSVSKVTKWFISDVEGLDPITLYIENYAPGVGKLTIECSCESWTYRWPAMGKDYCIESFIRSCDNDYLAKKFAPDLDAKQTDESALVQAARDYIIHRRREQSLTKTRARELYEKAHLLADCIIGNEDLLYEIYGDEWWYSLPKEPNPSYEYLCRILEAVRAAFTDFSYLCE